MPARQYRAAARPIDHIDCRIGPRGVLRTLQRISDCRWRSSERGLPGGCRTSASRFVFGTARYDFSRQSVKSQIQTFTNYLLQLHHKPVVQGHPPVHPARQLHVMGRDQRRKPGRPDDRVERRENMACGLRIKIAGRFVGEQ
jgi:hypothetical protein